MHVCASQTTIDLRLVWPWCVQGQRRESLQLIPGAMHSQDVVLDAAGDWLMQCRTTKHYDSGMSALLSVAPSGAAHSILQRRVPEHAFAAMLFVQEPSYMRALRTPS